MRIAHFGMVCLLATVSGSSAVIFQDNFDSEPSNGQLIYTTFINFNVTNGSVDLLGRGAFGNLCTPQSTVASNNKCVDLDGTTGVAGTLTRETDLGLSCGR